MFVFFSGFFISYALLICKIWDNDLTLVVVQNLKCLWPRLDRKKTFWRIFSYPIGYKKKALSDIVASSSSWKIANTAKPD